MDKDSSAAAESALSCSRCGKPAYLQCPKCVELKLPREGAAFCTQDCFKASWSSHKSVHFKSKLANVQSEQTQDGWLYCLRKGQTRTSELPYFDWTGALRPYPISQQRLVPEGLEKPDWAVDGIPKIEPNSDLQNIVEIKTPEQIERMRETCRSYRAELAQALIEPKLGLGWAQLGCTIAREVLDAAARIIRPGITTDEIDEVVHQATIAAGGYPSPLNYHFFPKSCCTSVNEVICHGIPDARKLEDGDIVNVDVTVYYKGVHGDLNETFFVGEVDEASQQLVRCTYECLEKAISIVKPGVRFREVGEVINRHATMSGLSVVKSYCGHGIGELFHCAPNIPHYGSILAGNKAVGIMKAGQTFTIEPMINAGVWRDRLWPDGWTAVTADGKRSAQFEHTLLVTETGVEVLTARLPSSPKVFPWLNS
ncbi:Removes the N-terminal methionine from nascent proteins (By similarity) [Musa troglodytarum]|uniref:Methionine aminopeptidase n=1 Tax=Musa troglodytarum TaxID=320322 RepID=A0A9E7EPD1_9LILI|nr:Removes the N-terminal methionine from nascent proteins (By similarity) [Musa troglodytarum]URD80392.1 Removes the N-terminal methionine from nascent proteins (By similarity) [Musa troglodytarum]